MTSILIEQSRDSFSLTDNLLSWINPYQDLETRIHMLKTKHLLSSEDKQDLHYAFHLANRWIWPSGRMQHLVQSLPKEHIQELLSDLLENTPEKEISTRVQQYLNMLSQAMLLDFSDLKTSEQAARWFHSRGLIKNSALKSVFEKEQRAIFKEFLVEAKHFVHHLLDILVGLLGINEIGPGTHSRFSGERMDEYAAIHKLESYGKLIGYPVVLFGIIYTYIQYPAFAAILTAIVTMTIIVTLVAYQRYGKPCPKDHFGLKNLNLEILHSDELTYVRQDILREIEKAFKEKKGVILVGEPGAGKSSIPRSLAEQIVEGKCSPFLKDCQVFSCGASKFNGHVYESPSFDSLSERFKNHKHQVIFFFDEFHSFFKAEGPKGYSKVDDIKMLYEDFKFIIGATTIKEYQQFIKNQQAIVDRRFMVVHVGKLQNDKIKVILSQYLQTKHPTIHLEVKAIDYIIKKAQAFNPNTSRIDAAQTLLNRVIKEIDTIEFKNLESKIDVLESEKKLIEQKLFHAQIGKDAFLIRKLNAKQIQIDQLKLHLEKKNQQVKRMRKIENLYLKLKEQSFRLANPSIDLSTNDTLQRQWVLLQAKIKILGKFIDKERKELDLPLGLDCKLIDKIINERKSTINKKIKN